MTQRNQSAILFPQHDVSIDTLRGFACILLVAYHVIGNSGKFGMRVSENSDWRAFADLAVFVCVPLFALISGYVFYAQSSSWADFGTSLKKKVQRLAIPLIVVSYFFYLAACSVDTGFCVASPWSIVIFPYAHFWFLQALLLIMVMVLLMNAIAGSNPRLLTVTAFPLSLLALFLLPTFSSDLFSFNGAKYLLPFFLLGQILRIWAIHPYLENNQIYRRVTLFTLGTVLIISWVTLFSMSGSHNALNFSRSSPFAVMLALSSCLFLFLLKPRVHLLSVIGAFSYAIYLFHPIFTSACRRLLLWIGLDAHGFSLFAVCLLAGILFPILLHYIAYQNRLSALLFLGIAKNSSSWKEGQNSDPRKLESV